MRGGQYYALVLVDSLNSPCHGTFKPGILNPKPSLRLSAMPYDDAEFSVVSKIWESLSRGTEFYEAIERHPANDFRKWPSPTSISISPKP